MTEKLDNNIIPLKNKRLEEIKNESSFPEFVYCRHMNEGLAYYGDTDEKVFVSTECLKRMAPSLNGKPIYIDHLDTSEESLKNLKINAEGYIANSFYNEMDASLWAKLLLVTDKAKEKVAEGYTVSNSYIPTEYGPAGKSNNIKFDKEILNGIFTQIALVMQPRYERSKIYSVNEFKEYQESMKNQLNELKNSTKENKQMSKSLMNFFKWKKEEITNASEIDKDTFINVKDKNGDFKEMQLNQILNTVENEMKNISEEKDEKDTEKRKENENAIDMDKEIPVMGGLMSIKELLNRYEEIMDKKNKSDKKEEDEKKNQEKKEDDKKEEMKNSHFYDFLQKDTIEKGEKDREVYTMIDGLKKGKEKY